MGSRVRAGADVSHLGVERNLFRYRPMPGVAVRATADASWQSVLRVVVAGIRAGAPFTCQRARRAARRPCAGSLSDQGVDVFVETDDGMDRAGCRRAGRASAPRLAACAPGRLSLSRSAPLHRALSEAVGGDPDLAVYANEVTTAGRLELLPFLHEQSITITAHRFGNPDAWSESVI